MDKKTLIAIIISLAILLGWNWFFAPVPPKPVERTETASENQTTPLETKSETAVLDAALLAPTPSIKLEAPVSIKTDFLEVRFDTNSGDIRNVSVFGWKDVDGGEITFNKGGGFNYMRLVTPIASGFTQDIKDTADGKIISFTAKSGDVIVTKEYTLSNKSYLIKAAVKVSNVSAVSLNIPMQIKIGPGLGQGFEDSQYIFEGAVISNKKTTDRIEADKSKTGELINPLWGGYTSKYFLFAAAGNDFAKASIAPENGGEVVSIDKSFIVNPGDRGAGDFEIYVGPKSYNSLKALGLGLQSSIDFGWFYFLAIPMLQLMLFFYSIFHNYGVAIIFLTILVKIVTLPLTLKGMKSMKAMTKLQPQMAALKEKFKGDSQKLNVATMELYKKHGVNPMSGCFPLIIQIPIFFALYKSLLVSIELKGAPFFGWIVDLSAKDPYYITPIVMGVTMFIQQKMTPTTVDPMQQKIFLAMPVIFTFLFVNFPSGLVVYWLTNNVLSIIQQYVVNKKSA